MSLYRPVLIALLGLTLLAACDRTTSPEEMLEQAAAHIEQAEHANTGDFPLALQQLQKADEQLEQLLTNHGGTEMAGDLRSGEITVGPYTLEQLRGEVIPRAAERVRIQREGDLFDIALYVAEGLPQADVTEEAAMRIGAAIQRSGDTPRALEVARRYGEPSAGMRAVIEARELAAEARYEESLSALKALEDPVRRAAARVMIAEMMADRGQYKSALEIIDKAEQHLEIHTPVFRTLARAYATAGNYEKALKYGRRAGDEARASDALLEIAMILNEQGRSENAPEAFDPTIAPDVLAETRELIEAMTNEQYRAEYLAVLAYTSADGGQREQASRWFDEARQQAETIESSRMRNESLGVVAFRLAGAGFEELALQLLEQASEQLRQENAGDHIAAELRPFEVYATLGDFDNARRQLLEINNRALFMDALNTVAIAMAEQGASSTEPQRRRLLQHARHLEASR